MTRSRIAIALGVSALVLVGTAWANVKLSVPEQIQPPAYLSPCGPGFLQPGVIQDGEWAALVFYRSPASVPLDFNLMDWFDPDLVDSPMLVSGFAVWPGDEPVGFPQSTQLKGLGAVPIWFVRWPELQEAMADGVLTILELASLESLQVGTAESFEEQLHFGPPHPTSHSTVRASGTLEGGGSFQLLAIENDLEWTEVRFVFK